MPLMREIQEIHFVLGFTLTSLRRNSVFHSQNLVLPFKIAKAQLHWWISYP